LDWLQIGAIAVMDVGDCPKRRRLLAGVGAIAWKERGVF